MYFDDDVNGQIIGGDYGQAWISYCGRKQGQTVYPSNESEAYLLCDEIKSKIESDCGEVFNVIYPLKDKWVYHYTN